MDGNMWDLAAVVEARRYEIERDIARSVIDAPAEAVAACECRGLGPEHFKADYPSRIVFIAGRLAWQRGRDAVTSLAIAGLSAEGQEAESRALWRRHLPEKVNPFFMHVGVQLLASILLTIDACERDAMEHYRYACRILRKGVAA